MRRAAQYVVEDARVQERLRQTEQRFRVALAHSNVTVFEQDLEGRYRWIYNPTLGYTPEDILGKTNDELVAPEDAARMNALDRAVIESGARLHEEVRISVRGETRHLLVSQEPLRDGAGRIVGLTGAATDITEQKRAQEQLAQALGFREQMMAILGHDLRNPLGAVRALCTLLLRREDLPESCRAALEEIASAGRRMLEMVETLLDVTSARLEGGLPVALVPTDLAEVCRGVVRETSAAAPRRTVELEVRGDGRGTWDPARIAQLVTNLVANALEHGAADGPVRLVVGGDGAAAVLEVWNDGPTIPPEQLEIIFEPFCRGAALRAAGARGLGLGLYIAREVVNAHRGSIAVESREGRGTTFTVRLPRTPPPEAP